MRFSRLAKKITLLLIPSLVMTGAGPAPVPQQIFLPVSTLAPSLKIVDVSMAEIVAAATNGSRILFEESSEIDNHIGLGQVPGANAEKTSSQSSAPGFTADSSFSSLEELPIWPPPDPPFWLQFNHWVCNVVPFGPGSIDALKTQLEFYYRTPSFSVVFDGFDVRKRGGEKGRGVLRKTMAVFLQTLERSQIRLEQYGVKNIVFVPFRAVKGHTVALDVTSNNDLVIAAEFRDFSQDIRLQLLKNRLDEHRGESDEKGQKKYWIQDQTDAGMGTIGTAVSRGLPAETDAMIIRAEKVVNETIRRFGNYGQPQGAQPRGMVELGLAFIGPPGSLGNVIRGPDDWVPRYDVLAIQAAAVPKLIELYQTSPKQFDEFMAAFAMHEYIGGHLLKLPLSRDMTRTMQQLFDVKARGNSLDTVLKRVRDFSSDPVGAASQYLLNFGMAIPPFSSWVAIVRILRYAILHNVNPGPAPVVQGVIIEEYQANEAVYRLLGVEYLAYVYWFDIYMLRLWVDLDAEIRLQLSFLGEKGEKEKIAFKNAIEKHEVVYQQAKRTAAYKNQQGAIRPGALLTIGSIAAVVVAAVGVGISNWLFPLAVVSGMVFAVVTAIKYIPRMSEYMVQRRVRESVRMLGRESDENMLDRIASQSGVTDRQKILRILSAMWQRQEKTVTDEVWAHALADGFHQEDAGVRADAARLYIALLDEAVRPSLGSRPALARYAVVAGNVQRKLEQWYGKNYALAPVNDVFLREISRREALFEKQHGFSYGYAAAPSDTDVPAEYERHGDYAKRETASPGSSPFSGQSQSIARENLIQSAI